LRWSGRSLLASLASLASLDINFQSFLASLALLDITF
jgi:hypothetical protein